METNTLDFMQSAYSSFNAFGALAGNKTIISGCELQGANNVTDGYIFYDNELLFFKGGIKQNTIVIIEEVQKIEFEDKTLKDVYKTRYAAFGVSGNSIPWNEFKRYYPNQPMFKEIKWVGANVQQSDLQRGWFFANGENGTDNIMGRGLIGHDSTQSEFNTIGKTGGEKNHSLTADEGANHTHTGLTNSGGGHSHQYSDGPNFGSTTGTPVRVSGGSLGFWARIRTKLTSNTGAHSHSLDIKSSGKGLPHNNLQPFVVAKAIQFIGG